MSKQVENYIFQQILGQGQYGSVYKGINKKNNEIVAIKQMNIEKFKKIPKLYDFIKNEIDILSNIDHQNVIKFIEILRTSNNFYLVYEYCNGGDLEQLLKKRKLLPESEANIILQQILSAFKVLVSKNILHRDLKPGNIIFSNNQVKVADFGFCKALENPDQMTKTMVGSPIYMAPEILKGYTYSVKADIWSIGVVYFEMLFGYCPFEDSTIQRLINQINQKPLSFPKNINNISKNSQDLLKKMLVVDPNKRIDWDDLINLVIQDKNSNFTSQPSTTVNSKYQDKSPRQELIKKQIPQSAKNQQEIHQNRSKEKYFMNPNSSRQERIFQINQLDNDQQEIKNISIERYKIIFLINVMKQVIESSSSNLGYELAIYLVNQAKNLVQKIIQKHFQKEQMSREYKQLMKIIIDEDKLIQEFNVYLNQQLQNKNVDSNIISKYLYEAKLKIQTSDFSDKNNFLTLLKYLIDLKDMDNFFMNNLNEQCSYEQQSYFKKNNNLFSQDQEQKILQMID